MTCLLADLLPQVFFYLMTVMAVIITHSVMRPWIGNDVKAFGNSSFLRFLAPFCFPRYLTV